MIDDKLSFTEQIYDCVNKVSKVYNIILANVKRVNNIVLIE